MKLFSIIVMFSTCVFGATVYEDFSDGIDDWTARCGSGNWSCSGGIVNCYTYSTCSALVFPGPITAQDGYITVMGSGNHVFGVVARLDNLNTGIYAYVSVDYNVARIRRVSSGATSVIFASLYNDFPEGTYVLVFSCLGQDMSLSIEHVESSQTWILNAVSAEDVKAGEWGIAAGETSAWWDWVQLDYTETGIEDTAHGIPGAPVVEPEMNPFSGRVFLSAANLVPGSRIEVFDLTGRRVQTLDPASGLVMFEPDAPGVYLALVTGTPGMAPLKLVCLP
jgi:hypothetical protein